MKKLLTILICVLLYSCSTNTTVVNKTETKQKLTPTTKYFNKKMNNKKYGLVTK
jgi:uncharacterized protein YceK